MPAPQTDDQKARAQALVLKLIRATGAVFMLAGAALALNLGGVADWLRVSGIHYIAGGALFLMGLVDFFVMPPILAKAFEQGQKK